MSSLLNSADRSYYKAVDSEAGYVYYEEEEWTLSKRVKHVLIAGGIVLSGVIIYIFCFLLPGKFIPELVPLVGIAKVQHLAVDLAPVSAEVTKSWNVELWDTFDHEDEDLEEEDYDDEIEVPEDVDHVAQKVYGSKKKATRERIILVGDIHGQYIQLRKLLRKVHYNKKSDHILVLGDFITKGPDSIKVLDFLIDNKIDCILGNHEWYVLQNYANFHGLDSPYFVAGNSTLALRSLDLNGKGFIEDPEYLLAKKLQPHHVKYINQCGMIKELGKVPLHSNKNNGHYGSAQGLAVHAGLRWDLTDDLNEQDPTDCLEMRSYLEPFYNETTDDSHTERAVSWSKIWNGKNKNGTIPHNYVVYYGHDARRGLNLKKWAKGLDSGCVRGDYLTGMVLWQEKTKKGSIIYKELLARVRC